MKKPAFLLVFLFLSSPSIYALKKMDCYMLGSLNFFRLSLQAPEISAPTRHSPRPAFSLGLEVWTHLSQTISVGAGVLYKTKKSELVEFSGLEWKDTFHHFQYVAVPLLVRFRLPLSLFHFSFSLGVESDILLKSQIDDKRNDVHIEPIPDVRPYDIQLFAGAGMQYKRFSIECRYGYGVLSLIEDGEGDLGIRSRGFEFLVACRLF